MRAFLEEFHTEAGRALLFGRPQRDPVQSALIRVEKIAGRRNLGRTPGETPLAWLLRLQSAAGMDGQKLRQFAAAYEQGVYSRTGLDEKARARLRAAANDFRPAVGPEARALPARRSILPVRPFVWQE